MYTWNPEDYARHSVGQERWAHELIEQLDLKPDDRVLDIGCGDGRNTAAIAAAVLAGHATGTDLSAEFIAYAQAHYPPQQHPNLDFRQCDMRQLDYDAKFTVVFSNAAMHWVRDHRPVLGGISRALASGGRCLLQMGGGNNAAEVIGAIEEIAASARWSKHFAGFVSTYGFHRPDDYRNWLIEAGLEPRDLRLIEKDMVHADRSAFVGWLRTAWHPYTSQVPPDERDRFITAVTDRFLQQRPADSAGQVHVGMVRLQVAAEKRARAA